MTTLAERVGNRLLAERSLVRLGSLAILVILVFSIASNNFLTLINFQSMGFQVAEIGLLSLAVMLSMLTGGIDLSIVSVANIAALVTAELFVASHAATATGGKATVLIIAYVLAGLVAGTLCGVLNGLLITKMRITPILATLGTLQLLNGIAIIWTGGKAVYGLPGQFLNIGNGFVARIPAPVIVLLVAAAATAVFVNRTGIGLRVQLIGANPTAARYSGLNNDRVLMLTYITSAFLSSIAGILITARSASTNADYGASYVLLAIVIVVLGGVNPLGGYGTVTGVVLSAFVLQFVASGFNQVGLSSFEYNIAQGVILIGVMALNTLSGRWRFTGRLAFFTRSRRADAPTAGEVPAGLAPAVPPPGATSSKEVESESRSAGGKR